MRPAHPDRSQCASLAVGRPTRPSVRYNCKDATATASLSVEDAVKRRSDDLIELSHSIHAEPELRRSPNTRSCAKTQVLVAARGFEITTATGGLDTAFRADYGSGPLVIAYLR